MSKCDNPRCNDGWIDMGGLPPERDSCPDCSYHPPVEKSDGPYTFINVHYPGTTDNPEEDDMDVEGPCVDEICGVLSDLPSDGELKCLNIAFNAGRSTLLPLVRELVEALKEKTAMVHCESCVSNYGSTCCDCGYDEELEYRDLLSKAEKEILE